MTNDVAGSTVTGSTEPAAKKTRLGVPVALLLAFVFGGLLALQTRVNGALGHALGDGLVAATIAFGVGLLITGAVLIFQGKAREAIRGIPALITRGTLAWWMLLGGAVGSVFVISQGLAAGVLGTALFTVAGVAGQTVSGLVLDRLGLGPGGRRPVTAPRLIGAVLCLLAVGWTVSSHLTPDIPVWLIILPLVGGAAIAWQQAVNGRVRAASGSVLASTFVNFLTGTVTVGIVALVHGLAAGFPASFPPEPWLYVGGISAVIFIAATTVLVRVTGVLLLGLCTIAGQLVASLVIDVVAPEAAPVDTATVIGTGLTLVAVIIAALRVPIRPRRTTR